MKQINFKELLFFLGVNKEKKTVQDVREDFADLIYNNSSGIRAHALALKIYESNGAIELNNEEEMLIVETAEKLGTPAFIDSIREALKKQ